MEKIAPLEPIEPIIFASVSDAERRQTALALQEAREASNQPPSRRSLWHRLKSKQFAEAS